MIWPDHIRLLSFPAAMCCPLFFWNAIVYGMFSRVLPIGDQERKKFFYFGLTSLSLSIYSFGSVFLYSSPNHQVAYFWNKWQGATLVPVFICFVLFTTAQLGLKGIYWRKILPWFSSIFFPMMIWGNLFVVPSPAPKVITIGSYHTTIFENQLGWMAIPFFIYVLGNLFFLGFLWAKTYWGKWPQRLHFFAFLFFLAAAINDILVVTEVYHFFYLLELGFVVFILAMSMQLFRDYLKKSREIESLSEEMRFLMSTISHDFYSPLISIEGFSERLAKDAVKMSDSEVHYLERIQANSRYLRDLVAEISDYLTIGRAKELDEWVDAGQVVRQALAILDIPQHRTHYEILLPDAWPKVWGSEKRLKQIFLNLMQNSLKYGDPDRFYVRVRWEASKGGVTFCFDDKGPGIPPHLKDKIFTTFFREQRSQPGIGLGLAIVKKSVENLGGRVWVDTEYTEGARFCFWLPEYKEES